MSRMDSDNEDLPELCEIKTPSPLTSNSESENESDIMMPSILEEITPPSEPEKSNILISEKVHVTRDSIISKNSKEEIQDDNSSEESSPSALKRRLHDLPRVTVPMKMADKAAARNRRTRQERDVYLNLRGSSNRIDEKDEVELTYDCIKHIPRDARERRRNRIDSPWVSSMSDSQALFSVKSLRHEEIPNSSSNKELKMPDIIQRKTSFQMSGSSVAEDFENAEKLINPRYRSQDSARSLPGEVSFGERHHFEKRVLKSARKDAVKSAEYKNSDLQPEPGFCSIGDGSSLFTYYSTNPGKSRNCRSFIGNRKIYSDTDSDSTNEAVARKVRQNRRIKRAFEEFQSRNEILENEVKQNDKISNDSRPSSAKINMIDGDAYSNRRVSPISENVHFLPNVKDDREIYFPGNNGKLMYRNSVRDKYFEKRSQSQIKSRRKFFELDNLSKEISNSENNSNCSSVNLSDTATSKISKNEITAVNIPILKLKSQDLSRSTSITSKEDSEKRALDMKALITALSDVSLKQNDDNLESKKQEEHKFCISSGKKSSQSASVTISNEQCSTPFELNDSEKSHTSRSLRYNSRIPVKVQRSLKTMKRSSISDNEFESTSEIEDYRVPVAKIAKMNLLCEQESTNNSEFDRSPVSSRKGIDYSKSAKTSARSLKSLHSPCSEQKFSISRIENGKLNELQPLRRQNLEPIELECHNEAKKILSPNYEKAERNLKNDIEMIIIKDYSSVSNDNQHSNNFDKLLSGGPEGSNENLNIRNSDASKYPKALKQIFKEDFHEQSSSESAISVEDFQKSSSSTNVQTNVFSFCEEGNTCLSESLSIQDETQKESTAVPHHETFCDLRQEIKLEKMVTDENVDNQLIRNPVEKICFLESMEKLSINDPDDELRLPSKLHLERSKLKKEVSKKQEDTNESVQISNTESFKPRCYSSILPLSYFDEKKESEFQENEKGDNKIHSTKTVEYLNLKKMSNNLLRSNNEKRTNHLTQTGLVSKLKRNFEDSQDQEVKMEISQNSCSLFKKEQPTSNLPEINISTPIKFEKSCSGSSYRHPKVSEFSSLQIRTSSSESRLPTGAQFLKQETLLAMRNSQERFPFTISESTSRRSLKFKVSGQTKDTFRKSPSDPRIFAINKNKNGPTIFEDIEIPSSFISLRPTQNVGMLESNISALSADQTDTRNLVPRLKGFVRRFSTRLKGRAKDKSVSTMEVLYKNTECHVNSNQDSCANSSGSGSGQNRIQLGSVAQDMEIGFSSSREKSLKAQNSWVQAPAKSQEFDDIWIQEFDSENESDDVQFGHLSPESKTTPVKNSADPYSVFLIKTETPKNMTNSFEISQKKKKFAEKFKKSYSTPTIPMDSVMNDIFDLRADEDLENSDLENGCLCLKFCQVISQISIGTKKRVKYELPLNRRFRARIRKES
ncbi:uncharacterized protein LOC112494112 [Cephus cinctus]|uniref:Uncharacterized protein LOC112494112 n=1 Tax=Cephus cinctus TaxID=211228 RepID=A0AAJ7REV4_CEPCN|nr:uncharacterized protein LOC112494112 [Cephus cinctus]XP_024939180.1 uncharacterized protein LOC112494112 [Cephus cinctus]